MLRSPGICYYTVFRFTRTQSADRAKQWWQRGVEGEEEQSDRREAPKWWQKNKIEYGEDDNFKLSCQRTKDNGARDIPIQRTNDPQAVVTIASQNCSQACDVHCDAWPRRRRTDITELTGRLG